MSKEEEKKDNEQYSKNFTRFPNIIFVAFSDLSKEEKFLYGELRRVYWDMKPRFVTLRELSPLVHYSTGALSKMLPRLHDSGLIHAEVRREKDKQGKEKGNSKYHISIVDIWEINRYFFSCSPNEQDRLASLSSTQLVHEIEQACSPNEQPCSRNDTSLFTKSDKPDSFGEQARAVDALHNTSHGHPKDITKDLSKDTFKDRESTSPQPESHTDDSGSVEPTHTHSENAQIAGKTTITPLADAPRTCHLCGQPAEQQCAGCGAWYCSGCQHPDYRQYPRLCAYCVEKRKDQPTEQPAGSVAPVENKTTAHLSTSTGGYPQQSAKVSRSSRQKAKPEEPKLPPTAEYKAPAMPPADAEWKTTTCLLMFTAWRGKPLIGTYKNSQASTCAKALVQNYTRAQVEAVRAYMVEQDEWWSQHPEKVDVCSVGAHIHEKLAEMARKGKPAAKPKPTLVSCANMSAEEYAAYLRR